MAVKKKTTAERKESLQELKDKLPKVGKEQLDYIEELRKELEQEQEEQGAFVEAQRAMGCIDLHPVLCPKCGYFLSSDGHDMFPVVVSPYDSSYGYIAFKRNPAKPWNEVAQGWCRMCGSGWHLNNATWIGEGWAHQMKEIDVVLKFRNRIAGTINTDEIHENLI